VAAVGADADADADRDADADADADADRDADADADANADAGADADVDADAHADADADAGPGKDADASRAKPLVERYLRPLPRVEAGRALAGLASAAIDVSDGLASDLAHLCRAGGCGAVVDIERLPVSSALEAVFGA